MARKVVRRAATAVPDTSPDSASAEWRWSEDGWSNSGTPPRPTESFSTADKSKTK
ncbi:MAG: hypothetical protein QM759_06145 [Terricaulis sp.]